MKGFIRRLIDGRIKLYYHVFSDNRKQLVDLYISKNGEKLESIPTIDIWGNFANKSTYEKFKPYIKDNNDILEELNTIKHIKDAFLELINRYNKSFIKPKPISN